MRLIGSIRSLSDMPPIHANEMDRAVRAEVGEVGERAPEEGREFASGHFAGRHRKFPMSRFTQPRHVTRDPHVVRGIGQYHLGLFFAKKAFVAFRIKSVPA